MMSITDILHPDLQGLLSQYGTYIYIILFAIIFAETGLVVAPFLPGDSLLFATGALAAANPDQLSVTFLFGLLLVAAVLGDGVNYSIGKYIGPRAFELNTRLLKRAYLQQAQDFYEKHGGKTIIIARFVPFVRTFAPFVAGIGQMNYSRFLLFNFTGGVVWIGSFLALGYAFGNIPFVKQNITLVGVGIVVLSVLPIVFQFLKARFSTKNA
jgi:membrane-associated protein